MKLILLHGLGQTPSDWQHTRNAMDRKFEILCPDLSDWLPEENPSYQDLYLAFETYCQGFEEPLNLCGLSLGGMLVLQYAISHGDRINSMALIGARVSAPDRLLKIQNLIFHLMPERAFKNTGFGKAGMIHLSKSMTGLNFYRDLTQIPCRTLVICGEKDKANRRAALELREQIPDAELLLMAGAGHEVNRDAPASLGEALTAFFSH